MSRRLHGRRGLKFDDVRAYALAFQSPPSRAAWIEIKTLYANAASSTSPPSRAAWIEILLCCRRMYCRSVAAFTGGVD